MKDQSETPERQTLGWPGPWCDLVGDLLCAVGERGTITRTNGVWSRIIGESAAPFLEITHPDDRESAAEALASARSAPVPVCFGCRLLDTAGQYRFLDWTTTSSDGGLLLIGRDVTAQKKTEKALRDSQQEAADAQQGLSDAYQRLTFYMMNSPLAFVEWDRSLRVSYWSPEAERSFGWSADEVLDRHPQEWGFLEGADDDEFLGVLTDLLSDSEGRSMVLSRHRRPDGSFVRCEWYHSALRDAEGQVLSVFSLALDVTERKRTEADLLKIRKAVESTSDAICIEDVSGTVIYLNRAFTEQFGYSLTQINRRGLNTLFANAAPPEEVASVIELGVSWKGEAELVDHLGRLLPVTMRVDAIEDECGRAVGRITVCTDLRERKEAERELVHQAMHDSLTGLANRYCFSQRLDRAFSRAKGAASQNSPASQIGPVSQIACMFIDLDNFKVINDSLGHGAGDALLKTIAQRLQESVRPEDTIARLGGDEFVILIEDIVDLEQASRVARRVASEMQKPILLAGRELLITVSIGIATRPSDQGCAADLLRDADVAMYQAKKEGKAGFVLFDPSMNAEAMERLELEMDLRHAIERDELEVHFQPIIHLDSSRVTEVEALLRWQHPVRGLIGPAKFIPIAEESGLICLLGEWVLEQACTQAQEWQSRFPDVPPVTMSVNLSTRQLQQEDLVDRVSAILDKTGLPAERLKLEITESVMLLDSAATLSKLHALKALGIRLAVDDFGTGYSSMAYLSSLPVDTLKIDRAFISRLGKTSEDDAIVRAILMMAKTMGLFVTAEGIESPSQLGELRALGCDRGQGYLFAKPLTVSGFEQMLAETQADAFREDFTRSKEAINAVRQMAA